MAGFRRRGVNVMVEIKEVSSKADLRKFIRFPNQLYKGNPYFVPLLDMDEMGQLLPEKNPAYEFCESKCFLAYRDGQIVGRIMAILNHKYNEVSGKKYMRFSRPDFVDDPEVAAALIGAVEKYAREKGMQLVHGPMGFCDLDREGMLIEGFDLLGMYVTYYNYPYYPTRMQELGYAKDVDYVELEIEFPDAKNMERIFKVSSYVLNKLGLKLVPIKSMNDTKPYIKGVFEVINQAYKDLYGYVLLTDAMRDAFVKQFFSLLKPDFIKAVTDAAGEVVAVAIAAPNISRACQKANGRLFPFGFLYLLHDLNHAEVLDLYLIGVKPEFQGKGVNSILLAEMIKSGLAKGVKKANATPELEYNTKVQDQWKTFNARYVRRRRIFIKDLGG
jgi:GNAT superfamily N-acetyltransferase